MRASFAAAIAAIFFLVSAAAAPSADARLRALYTAEWAWRGAQYADDENGTKPVPDHLPKVDPASEAARLAYWQNILEQLDAIPLLQLSPKERVNYEVFRFQIANLAAAQKFRSYEMPANSDTSFWSDFMLAETLMRMRDWSDSGNVWR